MEDKLIELVKEHKELYDTNDPNYMKMKLKNQLWKSIAEQLNFQNGHEAKTTWLKMRNSYRDARRRQRNSIKSGVDPASMRLWRYQKQMSFLEQYSTAGQHQSHMQDSDDTYPFPLSSDNVERDSSYYKNETHEQLFYASDVESILDEPSRNTSATSTAKKSKKRKVDTVQSLLERSMEQERNYQQESEKTNQRGEEKIRLEVSDNFSEDPLYLFFISMYQLTRTMPPSFQHRVRSQLYNAVSTAEEDIMSMPSRTASSMNSSH
ncbi:uncharacterized protein LOC111044028 [Nilaparvata lugens]|uniref:uncharacterized protein LOC111044028 n=1 Tax=Nilaparvata lugens TaxID=108931 RepID=UPI00193C9FFF|nr:uncharacterized protein LOC111044028 [Nilaparvata lugens]